MTPPPVCPRCSGALRAPGLWSSDWQCERHGAVAPLFVVPRACVETVSHLAARSDVPLWAPLPLLPGWTVTGMARAGDDRSGACGTALALSGPSPLGGAADIVFVAEEPGVGLGAGLAGQGGVDPGMDPDAAPDAKIEAAGHPTALWATPSAPDRMAFVGEAMGLWLWTVVWPPAAELVLIESISLHDLRERDHTAELVFGAPSPYLSPPPAPAT